MGSEMCIRDRYAVAVRYFSEDTVLISLGRNVHYTGLKTHELKKMKWMQKKRNQPFGGVGGRYIEHCIREIES